MKGVFHLAFATSNLDKAKAFYGEFLACERGRKGPTWVDYNFFGHQLTIQYVSAKSAPFPNFHHPKSGFPLNHWGVVLENHVWRALREKLESDEVSFVVAPQMVMEGSVGEQQIMMLRDPDGNILEFKTFADSEAIFKT